MARSARLYHRSRSARLAPLEPLESRRVLAVSVAAPLADVAATPGQATSFVPLADVFAVSGVAAAGTLVGFTFQEGTSGAVDRLFVELYDQAVPGRSAAPISTANFLDYVTDKAYNGSFIHRASDFVGEMESARFLQGGSFRLTPQGVAGIPTGAPIQLEAAEDRPNVAGTIAYARTSELDSATSGFFMNVVDMPEFDDPAGPYAVFGKVVGDGLDLLTDYAAFPRVDAGSPFQSLPVTSTQGISSQNLPDRLLYLRSAAVVAPAAAVRYRITSTDADVVSATLDATGRVALDYGTKRGTATVSVVATDIAGGTATDTFTVTVDRPSIVLGGTGPTSLKFVDADGTQITCTHAGPGTTSLAIVGASAPVIVGRVATVTGSDVRLVAATFATTTAGSSFAITAAGGDGRLTIGGIAGTTRLGSVRMPAATVTDAIELTGGVTTLVVGGLTGRGQFGSGLVQSATLGTLDTAHLDFQSVRTLLLTSANKTTIEANQLTTLRMSGGFVDSSLETGSRPVALAFGSLRGSSINTGGGIGTFTSTGVVENSILDFGVSAATVRVGGLVTSTLRVGVDSSVTEPKQAADFTAGSGLSSLVVTGTGTDAFDRSQVYAGRIASASVGRLSADTAKKCTVVVQGGGSIRGTGPTKAFVLRYLLTPGDVTQSLTAAGLSGDRLKVVAVS